MTTRLSFPIGIAPLRREGGFTLVEMLVSVTIMMVVIGGVFAVFNPAQGTFQTQPEVADMQQRLRVGVTDMSETLMMAGAGTFRSTARGPLTNIVAAVFPFRVGTTSPDAPSGTFFRQDLVTILYVPGDAGESTLTETMASPTSDIKVEIGTGCPPVGGVCGFDVGSRAIIYDGLGGYDVFTVTGTNAGAQTLQHASDRLSRAYTAGSRLAELAMHAFYLRTETSSETYQLMHFDGYQTDTPLVDNVVGLRFDYFGDPTPPAIVNDPSGSEGPWTSYGPKPPGLGTDNLFDSWPAGENCAFTVVNGLQAPRLTSLGSGSLVPLTQAQLTNGPWCPDLASPNRYDVDLLRIRKIRVTLRVQTASSAFRGPAGTLFTRGGRAKDGARLVPDQEVRFDVTPRNVNLSR